MRRSAKESRDMRLTRMLPGVFAAVLAGPHFTVMTECATAEKLRAGAKY
jgi:hypothetical protein